ncbi:MAG TPA: hypothetical protein VE268_09425, partial [Herpetosiphonaceae bacterium]|nr:hypothetical protein [Herpetosiphonaceae bacterium]
MRTIMDVPREPPGPAASEVGGSLEWAALLAGLIACGVPLATGIATGWPAGRLIAYSTLTLLYLLLTQIHKVPLGIAQWLCRRLPTYLIVMGIVGCVLQSISGDPFVQPIVFTVPLVHAALVYAGRPSALVGAFYLLLMTLGLIFAGQHDLAAVLFPVASYGALMAFMYTFVRLSVAQAAARRQADALAGDLARQRDYLQRLVEVTATLTRDLDLLPVLELVAAEGRALAHAGQARIWLRDTSPGEDNGEALRLAAVVPPQARIAAPENGAPPPVGVVPGSTLRLPLIS